MTSTFPDISLSTDRLVLRPFEEDDVQPLAEMMDDELVTAWAGLPHPYTADDAREWVDGRAAAVRTGGHGLVLAAHEFLTQRLVGTLQLHRTDWRVRSTEVRFVTASWARGEGYACESVLALARWLFADQKFERLELRTPAEDTAAQQVAQRIGCISEGVLRGACIARMRTDEGWADTRTDLIVWGLLPEDLAAVPHDDAYEEGEDEDWAYPRWH